MDCNPADEDDSHHNNFFLFCSTLKVSFICIVYSLSEMLTPIFIEIKLLGPVCGIVTFLGILWWDFSIYCREVLQCVTHIL